MTRHPKRRLALLTAGELDTLGLALAAGHRRRWPLNHAYRQACGRLLIEVSEEVAARAEMDRILRAPINQQKGHS